MTWILVAIIVIAVYNAEKLPQIMERLKGEVPHIVDAGKKASKELKEKAQAAQEKIAKKNNQDKKTDNE